MTPRSPATLRRRPFVASASVAAALAAVACISAAPASAAGRDAVRCATARVPLDHDRPHGRKVALALAKRPATGAERRRIGTLFLNPGGPGDSGVEQVRGDAPPGVAALNRRFDIVGFDPRGVG